MDRYELTERLKTLAGDYLGSRGFELVDFICRYEGRDLVLRFLVDTPQGDIGLDECAALNKEISDMLDGQNLIEQAYALEVSSPGLDRPLITENDFKRNKNKRIKVFLKEQIFGRLEWDGIINKVEGGSVFLEALGNIMELPLGKINKAKQLIE